MEKGCLMGGKEGRTAIKRRGRVCLTTDYTHIYSSVVHCSVHLHPNPERNIQDRLCRQQRHRTLKSEANNSFNNFFSPISAHSMRSCLRHATLGKWAEVTCYYQGSTLNLPPTSIPLDVILKDGILKDRLMQN